MKVLVVSHLYPSTANEVAGIFVHDQVRALVKQGVEVMVVSPVPWAGFPVRYLGPKWKAYSRVPFEQTWEGIKVYYPRYLVFPRAKFFASSGWRLYYGIRRVVEQIYDEFPFDLIHAHVAMPDGYGSALLARRFGVPFVVTIHGQDFYQTVYRSHASKQAVGFVLRQASRIVVVSQILRTLAQQHFKGIDSKVVVVSNGIDLEKINDICSADENSNRVLPVVVSVSNLIKRKAIDVNIQAIARLKKKYPELQYWIVGSGSEEQFLKETASRLGVASRVHFFGRQPHRKALEYIANGGIFSLPSWDEAFGVVYIEAMALGKPVVGCQREGPSSFVEHGKTGILVKCKDVDSVVEALDFLLSHPAEAASMGRRARKMVLQNYTWQRNAEKNLEIYREVLSER